jgi:hypothetical protein
VFAYSGASGVKLLDWSSLAHRSAAVVAEAKQRHPERVATIPSWVAEAVAETMARRLAMAPVARHWSTAVAAEAVVVSLRLQGAAFGRRPNSDRRERRPTSRRRTAENDSEKSRIWCSLLPACQGSAKNRERTTDQATPALQAKEDGSE